MTNGEWKQVVEWAKQTILFQSTTARNSREKQINVWCVILSINIYAIYRWSRFWYIMAMMKMRDITSLQRRAEELLSLSLSLNLCTVQPTFIYAYIFAFKMKSNASVASCCNWVLVTCAKFAIRLLYPCKIREGRYASVVFSIWFRYISPYRATWS